MTQTPLGNGRVWYPHLDYAGEWMQEGHFRDPPEEEQSKLPEEENVPNPDGTPLVDRH